MTTQAIEGLRRDHADLDGLIDVLLDTSASDLCSLPSACAGWRVQNVIACTIVRASDEITTALDPINFI